MSLDNPIDRYTIFCGVAMFWVTNVMPLINDSIFLIRLLVYPVFFYIMFCMIRLKLNSSYYKKRANKFPYVLLKILVLLSFVTLLRVIDNLNIDNLRFFLFSNSISIVAWMMPIFLLWGLRKKIWMIFFHNLNYLIVFGILYTLFAFYYYVSTGKVFHPKDGSMYNSADILFLSPILLFSSIYTKKSSHSILGFLGILTLLIHMFIAGERFALAYCTLICFFVFFEILKARTSRTKITSIVLGFIFFTALITSPLYSSIINYKFKQYFDEGYLLQDTRGSLGEQAFEQMSPSDLLWGKGILGTYNLWFDTVDDIYDRNAIEIGYMQLLLKGGFLMVLLHYSIYIYAIYMGLFRTKNSITKIFAYIICSRLIIMSTAMIPRVGFEYYFFWLIIGACISTEFRSINIHETLSIEKMLRV